MRISTKGRYAVQLMLDLAVNSTGEQIAVRTIAARQGISEKYLEQIINHLVRAGFVKSIRGAQGGYLLARDPCEYTVGMILRATEGKLSPVACLEGETNTCPKSETCVTLEVWRRVNKAIEDVVDNITLGDLVALHKQMAVSDYSI